MADKRHPSDRKLEILEFHEDGGRHTSTEASNVLGIKIENARNLMSRYKRAGLLSHVEDRGYDGDGSHPYRVYRYRITDHGKARLDFLRGVKKIFESEMDVSWGRALEIFKNSRS